MSAFLDSNVVFYALGETASPQTAYLMLGGSEAPDFERYRAILDLEPDVPPMRGDELDDDSASS
jgi:hypothetical protein